MTAKNRVMQWPEFVQAVEEKQGTLIVDGDPRKAPSFWWTAEDICSMTEFKRKTAPTAEEYYRYKTPNTPADVENWVPGF